MIHFGRTDVEAPGLFLWELEEEGISAGVPARTWLKGLQRERFSVVSPRKGRRRAKGRREGTFSSRRSGGTGKVAGKQAAPGQQGIALCGSSAGIWDWEAETTNAWQQGSSVCSTFEPRLVRGTPGYSLVWEVLHYWARKGRQEAELSHPGEREPEFSGKIVTSVRQLSCKNTCRSSRRIKDKLVVCRPCLLTDSLFLHPELSITLNGYLWSFCPAPDSNSDQDQRGRNYESVPFSIW